MLTSAKILFPLLILTCTTLFGQTVRIFNTKIRVRDIIGTNNLSTQKYALDLPNVLVKNEDYYLKTIGSYRDSFKSSDPNSLFNLVDKGSYPLLDAVNMKFYDDIVIQDLKADGEISKRSDFIAFNKEWESISDFAERKKLLFKNEFIEIGKRIQLGRFTITKAPFQLRQTVARQLSATITADLKENLKSNGINVSGAILSYLSRVVSAQTEYAGAMLVIEFDDRYMSRLNNALNGVSYDKIGHDDFSIALMDYAAPESVRAATTGLVAFKLNGKINKAKLVESQLKADLKARFPTLDDQTIANITLAISIGFVNKVEKLFTSEIDNIYIKTLLTSRKIDDIEIARIRLAFNQFLNKA